MTVPSLHVVLLLPVQVSYAYTYDRTREDRGKHSRNINIDAICTGEYNAYRYYRTREDKEKTAQSLSV